MAEKRTIELEIQDNSKSLKSQYKEAVQELQKMSAQYGETSNEAIKAAKAAAQLKDQIAESNDLVNAFNPDAKFKSLEGAIGGVLNGFQAYQGAIGLMGVQNEELEATMLKVQSAMAFTQGINGVMEAGDAFKKLGAKLKDTAIGQGLLTVATAAYNFVLGASTTGLKLFRLALISTGIGALVVGVGLLVANFDSIVGVVKKVVGWFSGLSGTVKNILSVMFPFIGVIRLVIAGLEAMGIIDNEQERIKKENHEKEMKRVDAELKKQAEFRKAREKNFNNEQSGYDRAIKLAQAEGKSVLELQKQKINASIKYQETRKKELEQDLVAYKFAQKFLGELGGALIDTTDIEAKINELGNSIADQYVDLKVLDIEANKPAAGTGGGGGGGGITPQQKTDIDITRRIEDEKLRIKDESRQKELDALDLQYKRKKEDQEKELKDDKDKVSKLAVLNAQAVESRKVDEQKINDKYDAIDKEKAAKALEDKIKIQDEQWYALQKLKNSQQEQELLDLQIAYDKEFEAALNNAVLQKELTDKFNKDSAAINKKYKDEQAVADKAAADLKISNQADQDAKDLARIQAKTDMALKIAKTFSDVYNSLNGLMNASDNERLKGVEKGSKAEEEIKKRMFKRDKKLRIVQTIIDTASNVVTSVRNGGGIPTGIPFGIAAAAMGSLQIAAISKAKFGGEDGGGGGEKPPAPAAMTAQFNTVGNNGINQLAQLQQQPTMAYVVSGQVTSQQALDRNRAQNSSL
jgi:hypothetical protein